MTILLCGGGTLGPVTPLLTVVRSMKKMRNDVSFVWAGTPDGPEAALVLREEIRFVSIPVAKLSRYPSLHWLTWPRDYVRARRAARQILDEVRPTLVVGAGGFTQVPLMQEADRRKLPCVIHQLDAAPTLSNRVIARRCRSVTTSFEYSSPPFGRNVQTMRVSTPCRYAGVAIPDKEAGASYFFLDPARPIVFVFGGGTGALLLNQAMDIVRERLPNVQFIFATGEGRGARLAADRRTVVKKFLDERDMLFAYAASDVIVCRAGMGTLSELAVLSRSAIVVPIPNSHQEENAEALKEGIVVVEQRDGFEEHLKRILTSDPRLLTLEARQSLGKTLNRLLPTSDGMELAERWLHLINM